MIKTLFCATVLCTVLAAQPQRPQELISAPNLPAQRLGPRDMIAVSVYNSPELSRLARVNEEGWIQLPMLKRRIGVAGLMPSEVETIIVKALEEEELLVRPVVTVTVAEYASRPVSVMGAVRKPLTFQATSPVKLLDALTRAEGLTSEAGAEILVTRSSGLIERIPVKGLIEMADPALNLVLQGGEEVRIPESGRVFVVGNVRKPGSFTLHEGQESSVLKLLALSEGLLPFHAKQAYIYRPGDQGTRQEIPIELRKVLDRKMPDPVIQANDILYIPDNARRRTSMLALERILTFGSTTASGALVWSAAR